MRNRFFVLILALIFLTNSVHAALSPKESSKLTASTVKEMQAIEKEHDPRAIVNKMQSLNVTACKFIKKQKKIINCDASVTPLSDLEAAVAFLQDESFGLSTQNELFNIARAVSGQLIKDSHKNKLEKAKLKAVETVDIFQGIARDLFNELFSVFDARKAAAEPAQEPDPISDAEQERLDNKNEIKDSSLDTSNEVEDRLDALKEEAEALKEQREQEVAARIAEEERIRAEEAEAQRKRQRAAREAKELEIRLSIQEEKFKRADELQNIQGIFIEVNGIFRESVEGISFRVDPRDGSLTFSGDINEAKVIEVLIPANAEPGQSDFEIVQLFVENRIAELEQIPENSVVNGQLNALEQIKAILIAESVNLDNEDAGTPIEEPIAPSQAEKLAAAQVGAQQAFELIQTISRGDMLLILQNNLEDFNELFVFIDPTIEAMAIDVANNDNADELILGNFSIAEIGFDLLPFIELDTSEIILSDKVADLEAIVLHTSREIIRRPDASSNDQLELAEQIAFNAVLQEIQDLAFAKLEE